MVNKDLLDYIKSELKDGNEEARIRQDLFAKQWREEDINEAMGLAKGSVEMDEPAPPSAEGISPIENDPSRSSVYPEPAVQTQTETVEAAAPGSAAPSQIFSTFAPEETKATPTQEGSSIWAILSLVFGLAGLVAWIIAIVGAVAGIIGLFLGIKGRGTAKKGLATAGLVFSIIALLLSAANWAFVYFGILGNENILNSITTLKLPTLTGQSTSSTNEKSSQTVADSSVYTSTNNDFSITPPKDWAKDESGILGTSVVFMNAQADTENGNQFGANINVTSEAFTGTLDEYVVLSRGNLPKLLQDYKTITDKKTRLDNGEIGYLIGGTFTQGIFHLQNLQLLVVANGKAYITTATSLAPKWQDYQTIFEASLDSFEIL